MSLPEGTSPGQSGAKKRLVEQCRVERLKLAPGTPEKYPGTTVRVGLLDLEAALTTPATASNESIVSGTPLAVIRKALNQLTDHGSQECLDCLKYRRAAMEATEDIQASFAELEDVLWRIAAPPRNDGTYNLSREACEQLARKTLQTDRYQDAASPHNKERPRDVGAPGAAT